MVTDTVTLRVRELDTVEYIWQSKVLFHSYTQVDRFGAVLKEEKRYKDCITMVRRGNDLDIVFKVHHFYNVMILGQCHNANQLSVLNAIESVNIFKNAFKLSSEQLTHLQVKTLEFGLNIVQELYNTTDLLNQITFSKKSKFIEQTKEFLYKECVRGLKDMIIKVYYKSEQYPMYSKPNTFRFEIKYKNARLCRVKLGVDSLFDFLNPKTYEFMLNEFIKEFKEILILQLDIKNQKTLSIPERKKLRELYINPNQWVKSSNNKNTFGRWKKSYTNILNKTKDNLHTKLLKHIELQCKNILNEFKIGVDSPTIFEGGKTLVLKNDNNTIQTTQSIKEIEQLNRFNNSLGSISGPEVKKVCVVTGIEITSQKSNKTRFVSKNTCLEIYSSDRELWNRLLLKFVPRNNWYLDLDVLAERMSHNIRNKYHNPLAGVPKAGPNQTQLF